MDWFFPRFPHLTRDRFYWFARFVQLSFLSGGAFVLFFYHTPFANSDYDHDFKSVFYNWKRSTMDESGRLRENLRIKYKTFYAEEEESEE